MKWKSWLALWIVVPTTLLGTASAANLPSCAGPVEIGAAGIVRVEKNGALILRDGRAAHLEGIRLPAGASDHAPSTFADRALTALSAMTVDRQLALTAVPPKEDRYDRVRIQAFDGSDWIQIELLQKGLARVSIAPDRIECASELYAAEERARAAHAGLWSSPAYALRSPESVGNDLGTFQVVQGKVVSAEVRDGKAWLDFAAGTGFAVVIAPDDLRTYRAMGVDPRGYAGKTIRVRGIVQNLSGPTIAIANPLQIEVLQP